VQVVQGLGVLDLELEFGRREVERLGLVGCPGRGEVEVFYVKVSMVVGLVTVRMQGGDKALMAVRLRNMLQQCSVVIAQSILSDREMGVLLTLMVGVECKVGKWALEPWI